MENSQVVKEGVSVKLLLAINSALLTALLIFVGNAVNSINTFTDHLQQLEIKINVLENRFTNVNKMEDKIDRLFEDYDLKLKRK